MFYLPEDLSKFPQISFLFIKTFQEGNLFTISLNRPEKRNAFTPTMVEEIAFALEYANSRQEIWCVTVEAEGPVFCAGMDLNVFHDPSLDQKNQTLPAPQKEINLGEAFKHLHKPSIAKVKGHVLAGGVLIIAGCTFVVAAENVEFGLPEVKRGLFPMQVMASLIRIMPHRKALEMLILGKNYTAAEALDAGLVTHLSKIENVDSVCHYLEKMILENAPFAIQKGLEAYQRISGMPVNEHYFYLIDQLKQLRDSADALEGMNAFRDKRKPVWKNR